MAARGETHRSLARPALLVPLAWLALAAACGGDEPPRVPPVISDDPRRNVMVIDDGFDVSVAELRDNVVAQYSVKCSGAGADALQIATKEAAIALFRNPPDDCRLVEGIAPKGDPLAEVAGLKERWNSALRSSHVTGIFSPAEAQAFSAALLHDLDGVEVHGTATAGTITHANPEVRLVLVERPLGDAASVMMQATCLVPADLERTIAILRDPEVRDAYVNAPPSTLDLDLRAATAKHKVGIRNESFGMPSRQALERIFAVKQCPLVDLAGFFAVAGGLDGERANARPDAETTLVVRAAGNDGSELSGPSDDLACFPAPYPRLVVGAYDLRGGRSEFTNFGPCVDVYAPGVNVIAPIPGGWLLPVKGTSFSAPLVVRRISRDGAQTFTPASGRDRLLALRDGQQRVPLAEFPRDILFDPDSQSSQWALQGTTLRVESMLRDEHVNPVALRRLWRLLSLGRRP
jgi:hypothetical protein